MNAFFFFLCLAPLQDGHVLKDYHGGRLPNLVDNLDVKLTFRSRDVLSSLRSMTECGVLTAAASSSSAAAAATGSLQPPNWLDEVSVRGRNVIRWIHSRLMEWRGRLSNIVGSSNSG